MTLEDFFTLTEMKDGLTALARVEELVAVMKKKDGVVKNVGDMTRQWAAVASTIAATENKECLDLFIQLDGLCFIDKWLREAEMLANEGTVCFVEEAISALLQAVEKLQIDNERLVSSGICVTVKGLLSYKSLEVRDKARTLFDSWKCKNIDVESMDVDYVEASDDTKKISEHANSQGIVNDAPTKIPCDQMSNGTEGEKIKSTVDHDNSHMDSGPEIMKQELPDSVAKLDSVLNDPSVKDVLCSSDGYSVSHILAAPDQGTGDVIPVQFEHICEEKRHGNELEDRPDNVDKITASSSCVASKGIDLLSKTDVTVIESGIHSDMGTYEFNASERVLLKTSSFDDTNQPIGESTNELRLEEDDDKGDSRTSEQKCLEQGIGSVVLDTKDQGTTVIRMEEDGKDNEGKKQLKSKKKIGRSNKFARLTKTSKNADLIQQTANMELEDGTFDALEVARLVAKEVEREVGDYDEKSGSSSSSYTSSISDRSTAGSISQPSSPESINGERNLPHEDGPTNELQTMENMTPEAPGKEPCNGSATTETKLENNLQDMESSQLTDAVREAGSNTEKCLLEFDLNEEFLSEELEQNQVDGISNPVSVVSASRAVVAPGNSAGPLKFEGSLGWKGSAATSAFRPAPPRRTSDSDTGGATSSSSRQRQVFLDIDLNVAQGGDVKVVDHISDKGKQILGGLPSGESSVEMNCKLSERLKFDLNQTEEDGSQWKMGGLLLGPTKWGRSPSPASSSSCIQPASRSFDLNDNPCIANDPSAMQPFPWNLSSNNKVNHQEDSVISLLGTKIKKGTFPPQTESAFLNNRPSEPLIDTNMLRGMGFGPAVPYPQSVYGYNGGFAMGPAAPAPIYGPGGPVPYMFDTRGTPTPFYGAVPSSYSHPYMMGSVPAPSVDLNSGNRDPAFFRQLFIPGQGRPLENSRPLSSGSSGPKRKEPDSGWELYPAHFKPPHQPPNF